MPQRELAYAGDGELDLKVENRHKLLDTLLYRIANTVKRMINATPTTDTAHLVMNLVKDGVTSDPYIMPLLLRLMHKDSPVTIPVKFNKNLYVIGPNTAQEVLDGLTHLEEFKQYRRISNGDVVSYESMNYDYILSALVTRISGYRYTTSSFNEKLAHIEASFNLPIIVCLDKDASDIYNFLKAN